MAEWVSPGELQCGTAAKELAFAGRVNCTQVQPVSVCEDEVFQFHRIFHLNNTVVLLASSDISSVILTFSILQI